MSKPEAECNNEAYMNLGFQNTLRACAAICDMKRGIAFSYGVQGTNMCKGPANCSCKCWYSCSSTKPSGLFHLYRFKENIIGMFHAVLNCNFNSKIDFILDHVLSFFIVGKVIIHTYISLKR